MKIQNPKCPICESVESKQKNIYSGILNLQGNIDSRVYLCRDCRAYYLWPYISDELISELYSESYFTGKSESDGKLNVPSSNNDYEREFAAVRRDKFLETVETLLEHNSNAKSILDIGAATGDFLAIAREKKLITTGIELSSYASAIAKKKYDFEFHEVAVADYQGSEKYDLIHMNHVFEHFGAPHQVLDRLESLLSNDGLIYVEVPFQFNLIEIVKYYLTRQRRPFDVFSLHHPIFYRPSTLKNIFSEHGFNCRSMNVFKWNRYPAVGLSGQIKKIMWFMASLVGQGIVIEAIFYRK